MKAHISGLSFSVPRGRERARHCGVMWASSSFLSCCHTPGTANFEHPSPTGLPAGVLPPQLCCLPLRLVLPTYEPLGTNLATLRLTSILVEPPLWILKWDQMDVVLFLIFPYSGFLLQILTNQEQEEESIVLLLRLGDTVDPQSVVRKKLSVESSEPSLLFQWIKGDLPRIVGKVQATRINRCVSCSPRLASLFSPAKRTVGLWSLLVLSCRFLFIPMKHFVTCD